MELFFDTLKFKQREIRSGFPDAVGLRIHRALSGLNRAKQAGDDDAAFIFHWIAFNAACAHEGSEAGAESGVAGARDSFKEYFDQLAALDRRSRIFDVLRNRFPQEMRLLLENRFVFQPFWKHLNGVPGNEDWERRFGHSKMDDSNVDWCAPYYPVVD